MSRRGRIICFLALLPVAYALTPGPLAYSYHVGFMSNETYQNVRKPFGPVESFILDYDNPASRFLGRWQLWWEDTALAPGPRYSSP